MISSLSSNAATSVQNTVLDMEVTRVQGKDGSNKSPIRRLMGPRKVEGQENVDKKSLDYVLRSGLAGGLAGCAVCYVAHHHF